MPVLILCFILVVWTRSDLDTAKVSAFSVMLEG